ncbi:hypothetical protein Pla108_37660 [Botrimarina colliarenosi]|uniref:Uncharacterized protein n=1 Tax=Botrimarina colliarenosi TaxID=2528001 RepID=A0A5C6A2F5_9BACT|nr:hypothetical protein Pla108_37660 [Botrimarina colliarenosi]
MALAMLADRHAHRNVVGLFAISPDCFRSRTDFR